MNLMSNLTDVIEFATKTAKMSKKKQVQRPHRHDCTMEIQTHLYVIRDGYPEVMLTCDDDSTDLSFGVAARVFGGDMIAVVMDGTAVIGERHKIVAVAADRAGNIDWREHPYQFGVYGLSWDLPERPENPPYMTGRVAADMRFMMSQHRIEIPIQVVDVWGTENPDWDVSPEALRAFVDTASVAMIEAHGLGIRKATLFAEEHSRRAEALKRADAVVVVER